jgi:hypothetical protein
VARGAADPRRSRPAAEVAAELEESEAGQRRLLNRARAALRDAVADGLDPRSPR